MEISGQIWRYTPLNLACFFIAQRAMSKDMARQRAANEPSLNSAYVTQNAG
jgi:hypothetical protein